MSLFGAMNSAISGLTSQSEAFGDISDNVSNSQTTGFKRVDTSFVDYLTTSTATRNDPGAVVARPNYVNDVQGTITQTDNPLNVAIAGQGFFAVSQQTGVLAGSPTFNPQQFYSRAGDFSLNNQGFMVNSAGQFLNGWIADPVTGVINQNALVPIQVSQTALNPVATSNVDLSANLPATPAAGTATLASPISSDITVYDSLGTAHSVTLGWSQSRPQRQSIPNDWTVTITAPDAATPAVGTADVQFGNITSGNPVPAGTIGQISAGDRHDRHRGWLRRRARGDDDHGHRLRLGTADNQSQSRNLWQRHRRHPVRRHDLQPGGSESGRRAARQLRGRRDPGEWHHLGELQQRPDPHDRPGSAGDLQRAGFVTKAGRSVVHRHDRLGQSAGRAGQYQRRRKSRHQFGREFQRRYRHRIFQTDCRATGVFGEHQGGDDGERHAAGDDRDEAVIRHEPYRRAIDRLRQPREHQRPTGRGFEQCRECGHARLQASRHANQKNLVAGTQPMGVQTEAATRAIDLAVQQAAFQQDTTVSGLTTTTTSLQTIDALQGAPGAGNDLGSLLGKVQSAFSTLLGDPSSTAQQSAVVFAAGNLTNSINGLSDGYTQQRQAAQNDIVAAVTSMNTNLSQIGALNDRIIAARSAGQSTADLENQRDAAVHALSNLVGIRTLYQPNGDLIISTISGTQLPTQENSTPALTSGATIGPGASYASGGVPPIMLGGIDVTNQLQGGRLGADIALRDTTLPLFQGELDEFSQSLATRFDAAGIDVVYRSQTATCRRAVECRYSWAISASRRRSRSIRRSRPTRRWCAMVTTMSRALPPARRRSPPIWRVDRPDSPRSLTVCSISLWARARRAVCRNRRPRRPVSDLMAR